MSLFYLIHPADSNSRENSGILVRSLLFVEFFTLLYSAYIFAGIVKQLKQLLTKEIRLLSEETK